MSWYTQNMHTYSISVETTQTVRDHCVPKSQIARKSTQSVQCIFAMIKMAKNKKYSAQTSMNEKRKGSHFIEMEHNINSQGLDMKWRENVDFLISFSIYHLHTKTIVIIFVLHRSTRFVPFVAFKGLLLNSPSIQNHLSHNLFVYSCEYPANILKQLPKILRTMGAHTSRTWAMVYEYSTIMLAFRNFLIFQLLKWVFARVKCISDLMPSANKRMSESKHTETNLNI